MSGGSATRPATAVRRDRHREPPVGPAPLDVDFDARASSDPDGDASSSCGTSATARPGDAGRPRRPPLPPRRRLSRETPRAGPPGPIRPVPHPRRRGQHAAANHALRSASLRPRRAIVLRAVRSTQKMACSAGDVTWNVVLHHEEHTHPYGGPLHGARIAFRAPVPGTLHDARTTHLRVHVRASDTTGLIGRAQRPLRPRNVTRLLGHGPRAAGSGSPTSAW